MARYLIDGDGRVMVRPTDTGAITDRPADERAVLRRLRGIVFCFVGWHMVSQNSVRKNEIILSQRQNPEARKA